MCDYLYCISLCGDQTWVLGDKLWDIVLEMHFAIFVTPDVLITFSISGDGTLTTTVIEKLRNMGYKVKNDSQYNESFWSISWR